MKKRLIAFFLCITLSVSAAYTDASVALAESVETDDENIQEGFENTEENTADKTDGSVASDENSSLYSEDTYGNQMQEIPETDSTSSAFQQPSSGEVSGKETDGEDEEKQQNSGEKLVENSWRYRDGKIIPEASKNGRSVNAWSNVNGVFYNNRGEVIEGAVAKGIDVSEHQGTIDWEQVKKSDVDFVIIRCGYGSNTTSNDDKQWLRNVSECERLGIPYGVYIYSYAMSVDSAKSEADHVLRLLKGHNPTYPVFYDMENEKAPYDQSSLSVKMLGDMAEAFVNKIEAAGYEAGIYANKNWFTNYLTDSRFNNWYRWVAQYNYVCDYTGDYGMWQCTSSGKVPGINGNVDINFEFDNWKVLGIKTDVQSPQLLNTSINLSADTTGTTESLKYKFVWMKDNWAEWGVIQDTSSKSSAVWKPSKAGNYTLYVDVSQPGGNTTTVNLAYQIKDWSYSGIKTNVEPPRLINTSISVSAAVGGNTKGLKYKFVWMKDNWAEWGVIKDFSTSNSAVWIPKKEGNYQLFVNVQDSEGYTSTCQKAFSIINQAWAPGSTEINQSEIEVGKTVKLTQNVVSVISDKTNLQYKFVWMQDNWSRWGVIRDFSSSKSVNWTPEVTGQCTIYIDIKDDLGNSDTVVKTYNVAAGKWNYVDIVSTEESPYAAGDRINLHTEIDGNSYGLQYKYVWMKDNWKEWGVIRDFSNMNDAVWVPKSEGSYYIYVDIKDLQGQVVSKNKKYEVVKELWQMDETQLSTSDIEAGDKIGIKQTVEYFTTGSVQLQYKYVWMKDNWAEWGVIKDFSSSNYVTWQPQKAGTYKIYVDVKDNKGNTETSVKECTVKQGQWQFYKLASKTGAPYISGEKINLETAVQGNSYGLQYKYVWMKNDWKEWGVIRDFSKESAVDWRPDKDGVYSIYLDIKDTNGHVTTYVQQFNVVKPSDFYVKAVSAGGIFTTGGQINIVSVAENTDKNTLYKYVWMKDNWKEWGVIQDYSTSSEIVWAPKGQGEYTIFVDLKRKGESTVTSSTVISVDRDWSYDRVAVNSADDGKIEMIPRIFGNTQGFTYKYVWMKNNWAEWGVISDFSEHDSMTWKPKESGQYELCVDVKDANGVTRTVRTQYLY